MFSIDVDKLKINKQEETKLIKIMLQTTGCLSSCTNNEFKMKTDNLYTKSDVQKNVLEVIFYFASGGYRLQEQGIH
jgi:NADH:ubiquinone oxidoreductase subunit E